MELIEKQQAAEAVKIVVLARWFFVTVAVIQVVSLQIIAKATGSMTLSRLVLLSGICYGYNFLYWLYLRRAPEKMSDVSLRTVRVLQVVGDMIVISMMLYFDRTVTIFVSAFFLDVVLIASVIYKKLGILLTTIATCLLFTVLAYAEYLGYFPPITALYYYGLKGNFILLERTLIFFYAGLGAAGFLSGCIAALFRRRERRLKEQVVLVEEARFAQETEKNKVAAVIQNLTDGLMMIDNQDKIILINQEAEKTLNVDKSLVIGRTLDEVAGDYLKKVGQLYKENGGQLHKKELVISDGKEIILELSTAVVVDTASRELGKLLIFHDITREKTIDRLKSDFVTIAAHQLRTPLSAVKWALNLVLDGDLGKVDARQEEVLKRGNESNERMIVLINDLLNVARIEEGRFIYKLQKLSFPALIKEAAAELQPFIQKKNITLKIDAEEIATLVDKEKITLAIKNLIENAVNYSPGESVIFVSLTKHQDKLLFSVKDQGIGIPQKQQELLYTRFFRGSNAIKTDTEGTGLGLFIVKNIIESHDGKIWFESQENRGTTFYFELPIRG